MTRKYSLNLPEELLQQAVKASGVRTMTEAVVLALRELINKYHLCALASLGGTGRIQLNQSQLKSMRRR